ncbi:acetyl-CoA synthetase-like protein [Lichtheimia hyalospora FSU 10163]|nr:acetyl-CoA synthetase-like protein [Lichtheimia hyalospora FSU 10163]
MANEVPKAFIVPHSQKPGQSAVYRGSPELVASFAPNVNNLYDIFRSGYDKSCDQPCLGHRPMVNGVLGDYYEWQTYRQVDERIKNFGSGLQLFAHEELGIKQSGTVPLGVWSVNRPEWHIADWACSISGFFVVALYDTLGPDVVEYIINHAEIEIVLCTKNHVLDLIKQRSKLPNLKGIISIDPLDTPEDEALRAWSAEKNLTLVDYAEIESRGQQKPMAPKPASPNDVACIMYTSGTTGKPKGVILTHANFVAAVTGILTRTSSDTTDTSISYLPLAHIYGRLIDCSCMAVGARLGFFSGSIDTLLDDMQILKPTIFSAVPRLLNKVYGKIMQATVQAPGFKGSLFRKAVEIKMEHLLQEGGVEHPVLDRLLFNKVRQVLGGNVRFISSGSAPLGKDVLQFLRVVLCCDIREGFGATETCSSASVQVKGDNRAGNVGIPMDCNEFKLVDVPEMNYLSTDKPYPRGELCVRGYNISQGYYKEAAKTKEAFDDDGFYHTGDIAMVDETGSFVIVDRKKNIFKLAQGEYVAPEKIENIYSKDTLVAQIFVHGDSLQNSLVGVVVPDPEELGQLVKETLSDLVGLSYPELCRNPRVNQAVLKRMTDVGKAAEMRGFEFVKAIHLESQPFTIESNLLTPTLKLKRADARKFYDAQINELYHQLANATPVARL